MLAAVVLVIHKNWVFVSVGTSDGLDGWTFIWKDYNCIVLKAFGHGAVAEIECLILLR